MPTIVVDNEPKWSNADYKKLPNLRVPNHVDEDDNPAVWQCWLKWRCEHGVWADLGDWLVQDWSHFDPETGDLVELATPFCDVCFRNWQVAHTEAEARKVRRKRLRAYDSGTSRVLGRARQLEPGEARYRKDKLFDWRRVYPETFTRRILLRGRTLTGDLRLQEDPETGKERLETTGGYVAASFGYRKAGKGHGPDMDVDQISTSGWSESEDTALYDEDDECERKRMEWEATWPRIEEWEHYSFPVLRDAWAVVWRGLRTNPVSGLGLKYTEFFDATRANKMPAGVTLRQLTFTELGRWVGDWYAVPTAGRAPKDELVMTKFKLHAMTGCLFNQTVCARVKTFDGLVSAKMPLLTPNAHSIGERIPDPYPVPSFIQFYLPVPASGQWRTAFLAPPLQRNLLRWLDGAPIFDLKKIKRPSPHADLDEDGINIGVWASPLEWINNRCRFRGAAILHYEMATARHFAQWARKAEYQRGGGEHKVPLRRTDRWPDNWRDEQRVRVHVPGVKGQRQETLSTKLDMYRWGVLNTDPTQESLPDIPCGVAHRTFEMVGKGKNKKLAPVTRELQVKKLCETAYENYRKAVLHLRGPRFGTVGFWKHTPLGDSDIRHSEQTRLGGYGCEERNFSIELDNVFYFPLDSMAV